MTSAMDLAAWRQWRLDSSTGDLGDLSLIALHELAEPSRLEGLPGVWSPADGGLLAELSPEDGAWMNGRPASGEIRLEEDGAAVRFPSGLAAAATSQPGSPHLLAVWDPRAERLGRFDGIDVYPEDEMAVWTGVFEASADGTADFRHQGDRDGATRRHGSPGEIVVQRDGETFRLVPFGSGEGLVVTFADRTSGPETYGPGRMLLVAGPLEDGQQVKLDFNRAFLPPCAFSPAFNCPLPPRANRLPLEIRAGEKNALWKSEQA
ncbi:DUF1684 domain-containing protein [Paenibacillus albicereus]|uniref:DUF1684 domain-containing protein n=1 Tax=Paenibacillus albicereus TaxID=2726185 RepID=A0A6H2GS96_9BACL|nr:DUF1684 domain-containing protein [Paenibacillus albicereus]QJC50301.1 DUF1684 domain-containing protein [Paenibacillus albicereus]